MKATLSIVAILCLTGLGQACCPPFWSQFRGRCYCYVGYPSTWFEAREYCYHLAPGKSYVVSLNSDLEASHVHKIFQESGAEKHSSYWIGLHDFYRSQRRFEWDNGAPLTPSKYSYWNGGEPNNKGDEDGVEVYRSNRRWNDHGAVAIKRPFFCEMARQ